MATVELTKLTALEKESERKRAGERSKVLREQWLRSIDQLGLIQSQLGALRTEIRDNGGSTAGAEIYTPADLADINAAGVDLIDELVAYANTLPGVTATRG